jgi:hypothetical protein
MAGREITSPKCRRQMRGGFLLDTAQWRGRRGCLDRRKAKEELLVWPEPSPDKTDADYGLSVQALRRRSKSMPSEAVRFQSFKG